MNRRYNINRHKKEDELLALPEVREKLKQMAKSHWESWFDEEMPALDHKTPREAVKTKDGRKRLEALLLQYEYHEIDKNDVMNFFKADVNYLKKELGL